MSTDNSSNRLSFDVVIAGGGFSGAYCAKYLSKHLGREGARRVALVADENVLAFQPMLAEVAGASLSPLDVVTPLREFCRGANVLQGSITQIDLDAKTVELDAGRFTPNTILSFQHLVLALGGIVDLSRVPGMTDHGYILKDAWDAVRLRVAILERLEEANLSADPATKRRLLTFAVVGGGYSGVETAGQILDLVRNIQPLYHNLAEVEPRVVLIHSRDHLLPEIGEKLGTYAEKKLRARGMEILLNKRVASVSANRVYLADGESIETHTVISTVGNAAHPLLVELTRHYELASDHGRIVTDPSMRVPGREGIWAVGDGAAVPHEGKTSCPPTAQFALRQGIQVAGNIASSLNGGPLKPFHHKSQGQLASIGHRTAVADVMGVHFSGIIAWFIWRTIYLSKLPGLQRKLRVMIAWTLDLFFSRDISVVRAEGRELIQDMHLEKDDQIFQDDDPYVSFYIIKEGSVEYRRDGVPARQMGQGDHLGGPDFTTNGKWQGEARALNSTSLICINRKVMKTLFTSKVISDRLQPK